jgi:hypothetical protein
LYIDECLSLAGAHFHLCCGKKGGLIMGLGNLFRLDMRRMVGVHQGRERTDVLLTILLPGFLMLVSAYTNAWALTGGNLSFAPASLINTIDALLRGLFIEALVFSCFKLFKMLLVSGRWASGRWLLYFAAIFPALVGLMGVVVSAGCGLAWVAKSGQMDWMVKAVSAYLPFGLGKAFQSGLGLLFPVALVVYALYDIEHLIKEHVRRGADLSFLAVHVQNAEHHQNMLLKMQKEENEKVREQYRSLAQMNTQQALNSARSGDYSFGLKKALEQAAARDRGSASLSSQTYVRPVGPPPVAPRLPEGNMPTMPMSGQPLTGQFGPAPAWPSGNTQNIPVPPLPPLSNGGPYGGNTYGR